MNNTVPSDTELSKTNDFNFHTVKIGPNFVNLAVIDGNEKTRIKILSLIDTQI